MPSGVFLRHFDRLHGGRAHCVPGCHPAAFSLGPQVLDERGKGGTGCAQGVYSHP